MPIELTVNNKNIRSSILKGAVIALLAVLVFVVLLLAGISILFSFALVVLVLFGFWLALPVLAIAGLFQKNKH